MLVSLDTDHDSFITVRTKKDLLQRLRVCLGLTAPESDTGIESSLNMAGISELEKIIEEIFPRNRPSEMLELAEMSTDDKHCLDEPVNLQENLVSTPLPCRVSVQDSQEETNNIASVQSPLLEESKGSCYDDSKYAEPYHGMHLSAPNAQVSVPQTNPLQRFELAYEDSSERQAEEETVPSRYPEQQKSGSSREALDNLCEQPSPASDSSRKVLDKRHRWIEDIIENGVLTADPLMLLSLLLIVSVLIDSVIFLVSYLTF